MLGRDHPIVGTGNQPLPKAEVFDAEAIAALQGLEEATASVQARFASNVYICPSPCQARKVSAASTALNSARLLV
jgi:hypothetical protein